MNPYTAYKIDVKKGEIYPVQMNGDYRDIYAKIENGCTTFEAFNICETDSVYYDGEGLYKENIGGWMMDNFIIPVCGNALIVGTDGNGASVSPLHPIEFYRSRLRFFSKEPLEPYKNQFN